MPLHLIQRFRQTGTDTIFAQTKVLIARIKKSMSDDILHRHAPCHQVAVHTAVVGVGSRRVELEGVFGPDDAGRWTAAREGR